MFVEVLCMASAVVSRRVMKDFTVPSGVCHLSCFELPSEAGCGFGMVWEKAEGPPRVFQDSSLIRQASCWFLQGRLGRNDCLVSSPSGHPSWQEGSYRFRWGLVIKWSNSHVLGIWYWYVIIALSDSQPSPKTWSFQEHRQQEAASHFTQISSSREITGAQKQFYKHTMGIKGMEWAEVLRAHCRRTSLTSCCQQWWPVAKDTSLLACLFQCTSVQT